MSVICDDAVTILSQTTRIYLRTTSKTVRCFSQGDPSPDSISSRANLCRADRQCAKSISGREKFISEPSLRSCKVLLKSGPQRCGTVVRPDLTTRAHSAATADQWRQTRPHVASQSLQCVHLSLYYALRQELEGQGGCVGGYSSTRLHVYTTVRPDRHEAYCRCQDKQQPVQLCVIETVSWYNKDRPLRDC